MTLFFSPHMGGAQWLARGNSLIYEGDKSCILQVTKDGDIVPEFLRPHIF